MTSSHMSAEWWHREADRYCGLHISAHQRILELEAENERLRKLIARYRRPMVDDGVNPRERLHVLKVKLVDAEIQRDEALAALREMGIRQGSHEQEKLQN